MPEQIIPGTTPMLTIDLGTDVSGWDAALLTIQHGQLTLIERREDTLELSDDGRTVSATLTQAETLRLPNNATLRAQLRVLQDGTAMSTDVLLLDTAVLLGRKELSANT